MIVNIMCAAVSCIAAFLLSFRKRQGEPGTFWRLLALGFGLLAFDLAGVGQQKNLAGLEIITGTMLAGLLYAYRRNGTQA